MRRDLSLARGTRRFTEGLLRMPLYTQIWLVVLGIANSAPAIYWLQHVESRVVLITFVVNVFLMLALTARYGFRRILGAGHFLWYPLILYLLIRMDSIEDSDMRVWLVTLIVLNTVSLIIDTVDVAKWLRGDREELVDFGE